MTAAYRGAPPPTKLGQPVYGVIAPRPGETADLTILDTQILGVWCHWVIDPVSRKGRSRLCLRHEGECPRCGVDRENWMGFVAAFDNTKKTRVILRVGPTSARRLAAFAVTQVGLVGVRVNVSHVNDGITSSLAFVRHSDPARQPLPEPHGIHATLCMVLDCASIPDTRFDAGEAAQMEGR